ncbi:MAG: SRPBCC domain-containing protein [Nitrososphaera sp.]|jgi:hypothetical protein
MEVHTCVAIDAPAFSVWNLLVDFANYSKWNPFITRIRGELKQGSRLDMDIMLNGKAVAVNPIVAGVEIERQIVWEGKIGNLFASEHRIAIEPLMHDRVTLVQSERFSGPVVSLVARKLDTILKRGFEEMNSAIKQVAEKSWSGSIERHGVASPV